MPDSEASNLLLKGTVDMYMACLKLSLLKVYWQFCITYNDDAQPITVHESNVM